MKTLLTIIRWFVGLLFIFSGLIKANDPLGLSYKMQEFFEVWGWHALNDYTLALSIGMNVLEVVAGVAVIVGWRMKVVSWFLLVLILFFTFLTGYALLSGKIKTCGCFGDCLPLTPLQSFLKDILLLLLIVLLVIKAKLIRPSTGTFASVFLLGLCFAAVAGAQFYVLKHLPFIDCLPYKMGNNIQDQMKMPEGAIPDSVDMTFRYKKDGKIFEFNQAHFPEDFDSTYEYVDRYDKVVRKGNGLQPAIIDFSLQGTAGDTTAAVFAQEEMYILLLAKDMDHAAGWKTGFERVAASAAAKSIPVMIVTAAHDKAAALFPTHIILSCDATVIKTAARVNPTYFVMQGATILGKFAGSDYSKTLQMIADSIAKPAVTDSTGQVRDTLMK
ncbi:BT_3928 family protein [Sediminibacterium ginsengisoli]|uniref:DoxX protein n=1 Tax=Sediminibacterium ginsengisoli TaxID=413434 RepID=A0A1T4RBC1_9BACT|nr:BT_3928 family protein [Sediminibacterium ginsengisoli]SKA13263.1 DoxX protein [Sediminibacterium ginsengisoli]